MYWAEIAPDVRLRFEWWGGAYIDVARGDDPPAEVIDVWNSANDTPAIERTQAAFEGACLGWIAAYSDCGGADALAHDARTHW